MTKTRQQVPVKDSGLQSIARTHLDLDSPPGIDVDDIEPRKEVEGGEAIESFQELRSYLQDQGYEVIEEEWVKDDASRMTGYMWLEIDSSDEGIEESGTENYGLVYEAIYLMPQDRGLQRLGFHDKGLLDYHFTSGLDKARQRASEIVD